VNFVEIIAKKRDGLELSAAEVRAFVDGASDGHVGDEQLAAMLMAICIRGASPGETRLLVEAMRDSGALWRVGETFDGAVDKHSTGGVGDTVSLVFAPLVASCGVPVVMMAGAGLGHTQGTLDKLAAIPGFRAVGTRPEAIARLDQCGVCFAAQSDEIAPADKKLYLLRDLTATVPSLPLIVASIMSKKLAVGANRLVLDVKCGSGAFCKTPPAARELADALVGVARSAGVEVRALISDMDQPLGDRLGCAGEVRAALEVLAGSGDARLRALTLELALEALVLSGRPQGPARSELERNLANGKDCPCRARPWSCRRHAPATWLRSGPRSWVGSRSRWERGGGSGRMGSILLRASGSTPASGTGCRWLSRSPPWNSARGRSMSMACARGWAPRSPSSTRLRNRQRWCLPVWEARRKLLYRMEDVGVSFSGRPVLRGACLQHNPGEKLLLLGRNGSGKTTLLRVVGGELQPDFGRVERASDFAAVHLEQHLVVPAGTVVLDFCLSALPRLAEVERALEETASRLGSGSTALIAEHQRLQEELERLDGYRVRPRAQAILEGVGLPEAMHRRPLETLSGGERTRVALARALLSPAPLLLLDEPTNHLDLVGVEFLAQELARRPGGLLLVTHDRELIDRVGGEILELNGGVVERFPSGYARYRRERARRREQARRAYELQRGEIARQEEFIRRNIAGQNTRQAQARQKLLDRMTRLEPPEPDLPAMKLRWPEVGRSGEVVLEAEDLAVGWSDPLLRGVSLALRRAGEGCVSAPASSPRGTTRSRQTSLPIPRSSGCCLPHGRS
jgi:pyrimidine-nucleoside phosphorylase